MEIAESQERVRKLLADPSYISHKILFGDEGSGSSLAAIHRATSVLKMNKPLYAGFAILELSKLRMFDHYYNYLKPKYADKIKLCFTDTDSFLYHVETEDVYRDMVQDKHLYDTSVYASSIIDESVPEELKPRLVDLYSQENNKVPGKFSDETKGRPIKSFVGLRSKVYSMKVQSRNDKNVAKGVPKHKTENFNFSMFKDTLRSGIPVTIEYMSIDSRNMQLKTQTHKKVALSAFDDKRYILGNGIETLAYGHVCIPNRCKIENTTESAKRKRTPSIDNADECMSKRMRP